VDNGLGQYLLLGSLHPRNKQTNKRVSSGSKTISHWVSRWFIPKLRDYSYSEMNYNHRVLSVGCDTMIWNKVLGVRWPATWVGYELGGSALHQCRWAGCCLFAAVVIVCGLLQGLVVFFIDLLFLREQSPWSFSGLSSCVLAYCGSAAQLLSLQSFYNYARSHYCSGVCWEEGMGDGGVFVLQDVGTMKSLHWRCEMWFYCVERKRSFLSGSYKQDFVN